MSDTDKATEVESEEKKGDCLTPSASSLALIVMLAYSIVRMVMA